MLTRAKALLVVGPVASTGTRGQTAQSGSMPEIIRVLGCIATIALIVAASVVDLATIDLLFGGAIQERVGVLVGSASDAASGLAHVLRAF